jgi:lipid-binding SYLF domain-containing protein
MSIFFNTLRLPILVLAAALSLFAAQSTYAKDAHLDREVDAALKALYQTSPAAKALGDKAKGILVFPNIVRAGFIVGAQGGDGALIKGGKTVGYYSSGGVSAGLQAGAQSYGYAVFFMSNKEMKAFERSKGWEIGSGPTLVIVDQGMAKDLTSTTLRSDIYAFIFDQKGLMGGISLKGSKISKIK